MLMMKLLVSLLASVQSPQADLDQVKKEEFVEEEELALLEEGDLEEIAEFVSDAVEDELFGDIIE